MGWLDLVPLPPPNQNKLYIGGLYALYQTSLVEAAGITHVLSVIDYDPLLEGKFEHLHIRAEDHPNENLLQHFDEAVRWIDSALGGGKMEKERFSSTARWENRVPQPSCAHI